jgi:hypothetical protein
LRRSGRGGLGSGGDQLPVPQDDALLGVVASPHGLPAGALGRGGRNGMIGGVRVPLGLCELLDRQCQAMVGDVYAAAVEQLRVTASKESPPRVVGDIRRSVAAQRVSIAGLGRVRGAARIRKCHGA